MIKTLNYSALSETQIQGIIDNGAVLKFYADWCVPCKTLSKKLESLSDIDQNVLEISIDKHPDIASQYKVMGIPTLVKVKSAEELSRVSGSPSESVLKNFFQS